MSGLLKQAWLESVGVYGDPQAVKTDQAFLAERRPRAGVHHILKQPGKPTQNAYIESFNGSLRDECLNEHGFQSLKQARDETARWRSDYNDVRPTAAVVGCRQSSRFSIVKQTPPPSGRRKTPSRSTAYSKRPVRGREQQSFQEL